MSVMVRAQPDNAETTLSSQPSLAYTCDMSLLFVSDCLRDDKKAE